MFCTSQFTKRTLAVALCFVATSVIGCVRQKPKAGTLKEKVVLTETKGQLKRCKESVFNNSSGPAMLPVSKTECAQPSHVPIAVPSNSNGSAMLPGSKTEFKQPNNSNGPAMPPPGSKTEFKQPNNINGSAMPPGSKTEFEVLVSVPLSRECFISQVIDNQKDLGLDCTKYSDGVSLVVLAKNERNEMCVILGEENAGPYSGKLNFIGGKIDKTSGGPEKLVGTLYDEVREELGIHLNFSAFKQSVIFIRPPERNQYKTMMCFCFLSGIDTGKWQKMYQKREKISLDWKYKEMSKIVYVPVSNIKDQLIISSYVKENIALIEEAVEEISNKSITSLHRDAFTRIDDEVPMLE